MQGDDAILWDIVEEHLDEAEFLWSTWERGLDAANLTAHELAAGAERRLVAHIDGLVLAAPAVVDRLLVPALRDYQRDRAAVAGWAWLYTGDRSALPRLCGEFLKQCDPPERRGIVRVLSLWEQIEAAHLEPALADPDPAVRAAALTILAAHGLSPGPALAELAGSRDPALLDACIAFAVPAALMAGLAGELGETAFDRALQTGLERHVPQAWQAARAHPGRRSAAAALGSLGDERDLRRLVAAAADPESRPAALFGLGFTGRRAAADACIPWLADPLVGSLAAEALAAIAGLDLESMRIEHVVPEPADDEVPPVDVDAGLPWIDPDRARQWWSAERDRFDPGRRYLDGEPASSASLVAAFDRAPMRRRHVLALELAVRTRGRYRLDTRDFVARQRQRITGLAGARFDVGRAALPTAT